MTDDPTVDKSKFESLGKKMPETQPLSPPTLKANRPYKKENCENAPG